MLWFSEIPLASWDGEYSMIAKVSYVPIMYWYTIYKLWRGARFLPSRVWLVFQKHPKKTYVYTILRGKVRGAKSADWQTKIEETVRIYNAIICKHWTQSWPPFPLAKGKARTSWPPAWKTCRNSLARPKLKEPDSHLLEVNPNYWPKNCYTKTPKNMSRC